MQNILSAIACNLDAQVITAALPLFEDEKIQAIEWSFDTLFKQKNIPEWYLELLQAFSKQNRLVGHGVFFSLFSGKWLPEQAKWLSNLKQLCTNFQFDHITEHFGFMTGEDFHKGAPIGIPFTHRTVALGIDRLQRIQDVCQCAVGLENLAFAYSLDEVKRHGDFLEQLVHGVNGFIILDLHNLYCQLHNFDISFNELIANYPLDKVREIHISGGTWDEVTTPTGKPIRRDTHDDGVPETVFDLLEQTLPLCPNLKYVVLEQLGNSLHTEESRQLFQADFLRMDTIVEEYNQLRLSCLSQSAPDAAYNQSKGQSNLRQELKNTVIVNNFLPKMPYNLPSIPLEDAELYAQQLDLSSILENSTTYEQAQSLLSTSSLANSAWQIEQWQPAMLETARKIAHKWKKGWES